MSLASSSGDGGDDNTALQSHADELHMDLRDDR